MRVVMKQTAALIISLILVSGVATAQFQEDPEEMDNAVLIAAQDMDMMAASSVADNFNMTLLETEADQLSEEAMAELEELQPSEAFVIGGPEAISDEVVTQIEEQEIEEVTRLYGETATDTSIEVSQEFWTEETEEAAVVQGPVGEDAVDTVLEQQVEGPVLISVEDPEMNGEEEPEIEENQEEPVPEPIPEEEQEMNEEEENNQQEMNNEIRQEVVDELERLNVQNVVLYTADEQAAEQLEELGFEVAVEEIEPAEEEPEEDEDNGLLEDLEEEFEGAFNGEEDNQTE